jgi:hypothetical protein
MGTIDTRTIHALQQQLPHQLVVGGVVAGEGDHDADMAFNGLRSEQLGSVFLEGAAALGVAHDITDTGGENRCREARKAGQYINHTVEIGKDVRLAVPE